MTLGIVDAESYSSDEVEGGGFCDSAVAAEEELMGELGGEFELLESCLEEHDRVMEVPYVVIKVLDFATKVLTLVGGCVEIDEPQVGVYIAKNDGFTYHDGLFSGMDA